MASQKAYVRHLSLQNLEEQGYEIPDNSPSALEQMIQDEVKCYFAKILTERQAEVFTLLVEGYSRQEIAGKLGVCIQAVYQLTARFKKKLAEAQNIRLLSREEKRLQKKLSSKSQDIVWFYWLVNRRLKAEQLYYTWEINPVLKDYAKPTLSILRGWLSNYMVI